LLSVGEINLPASGGSEILLNEPHGRAYRRLILQGDRLVGAILIGYPELFDPVIDAVKANADVGRYVAELEAGRWQVLENVSDLVPA